MPVAGRIANQVRFILNAAGRIVGYRNPSTDTDEDGTLLLTEAQASAVAAAYSAGLLDAYTGTKAGTISAVATWAITIDAGSGQTVASTKVNFNPPTDTIGAQRNLVPTSETVSLSVGQARMYRSSAAITVMHALGFTAGTLGSGSAYSVASTETAIATAITNDARFEWISGDSIKAVLVSLEPGATTRTATLNVIGYAQ